MLYKPIIYFFFLFLTGGILHSQEQALVTIATRFSQKEIEKLEKGRILIGIEELADNNVLVKAYLLFDNMPETCWRILSNTDLEKEYMKVIVESHRFPVSSEKDRVEYLIQWLFFRKKFRLIHYYDHKAYIMQWHLDPFYVNDLDTHRGYWQLYSYPGNRTLAEYAGNMAVKGLPRWFENLVKSEVIRLTMIDIKHYMDKSLSKSR